MNDVIGLMSKTFFMSSSKADRGSNVSIVMTHEPSRVSPN